MDDQRVNNTWSLLTAFVLMLMFGVFTRPTFGQEIVENPFDSELCDTWGTQEYPQTTGHPCITNADYYLYNVSVGQGEVLNSLSVYAGEINLRDSAVDNLGLRGTYHHYFWFDGDCTAQDNGLISGIAIRDNLGNQVFYKNRNEFALQIEQGTFTADNLYLGQGEYQVYIIHNDKSNKWDFMVECLELDWFVGGYIWLFNSTIGNPIETPEVYIDSVAFDISEDTTTGIHEVNTIDHNNYEYFDILGKKVVILEYNCLYFRLNTKNGKVDKVIIE